MQPLRLDHVAFWVADRPSRVAQCLDLLGMHVIDEQASFTLVGTSARHGKLTFFDAEGPREPGALVRVGLRVPDLSAYGSSKVDLGEGIEVELVEAPTNIECDLDHIVLRSPDPDAAASSYERLGFDRVGETSVGVANQRVDLVAESFATERPVLNHLGVLVENAWACIPAAAGAGATVDSVADAPNTIAVFVWGPDDVRIEFVEHKASFSLT